MPKNKFFTICYGIILVLVIIWLMPRVSFIFNPLVIALKTLFLPFFLAGILFYLFRPLIDSICGTFHWYFPRTDRWYH